MMELVDHPSKVEMIPGEPWVKRLKYTTVAELLSDYEVSNAAIGRVHCPVADYFRAHLNDPLEDVEAHVYAHPQWGPAALCETMWKTLAFNSAETHEHGAFIAAWVQHFCALRLAEHDFNNARYPLSEMLKHAEMRFVSPEAVYVVLAYLNAHHPNPRKVLEKPDVRGKFPGLVISRFAAPDFEDVA